MVDTTTFPRTRCGTASSRLCQTPPCISSSGVGTRRFLKSQGDLSRRCTDGWRALAHLRDNEPPESSESPVSASNPERLAEWVSASPEARSRALAKCLETIALKDPRIHAWVQINPQSCLLYTSDAADERSSVDLGG